MTKVLAIITAMVLNYIVKYGSGKHLFEFNIERSKRMLDYTVIEYNALVSFWYLDQQNR